MGAAASLELVKLTVSVEQQLVPQQQGTGFSGEAHGHRRTVPPEREVTTADGTTMLPASCSNDITTKKTQVAPFLLVPEIDGRISMNLS